MKIDELKMFASKRAIYNLRFVKGREKSIQVYITTYIYMCICECIVL